MLLLCYRGKSVNIELNFHVNLLNFDFNNYTQDTRYSKVSGFEKDCSEFVSIEVTKLKYSLTSLSAVFESANLLTRELNIR